MDLFYLAFIKVDILSLRFYLKDLYLSEEIRRLLTETFIPNFM